MIAAYSPARHRWNLTGPAVAVMLAACALTGARPPEKSGAPATQPAPGVAPAPVTQPALSVSELIAQARRLTMDEKYGEALTAVDAILRVDSKNDYAIGIRPLLEDKIAAQTAHAPPPAGESKDDRAAREQLDRILPEVDFKGVGLADVVDYLRDVSGANIFVDWKALEAAGVKRNEPVTATLRNVKFSKALQTILDSMGSGKVKVSYAVDQGVIVISTK